MHPTVGSDCHRTHGRCQFSPRTYAVKDGAAQVHLPAHVALGVEGGEPLVDAQRAAVHVRRRLALGGREHLKVAQRRRHFGRRLQQTRLRGWLARGRRRCWRAGAAETERVSYSAPVRDARLILAMDVPYSSRMRWCSGGTVRCCACWFGSSSCAVVSRANRVTRDSPSSRFHDASRSVCPVRRKRSSSVDKRQSLGLFATPAAPHGRPTWPSRSGSGSAAPVADATVAIGGAMWSSFSVLVRRNR